MLKKIGVIGGGNIGGVLVQEIARRKLARKVGLIDILAPDFAKGKCLDIAEGTPVIGVDVEVEGAKDYSPKNKLFGMAGVLDSARYRYFVAKAANVSVENVEALVLGGHGDTMVPIRSCCRIAGMPVEQFVGKEDLQALESRTRKAGGEVVKLLGSGSAFVSPAWSALEMVEAINGDSHKIMPVCALLEGEYGVNGLFVGVPAIMGRNGIEKVVEVQLTDGEKAGLDKSVEAVRKTCAEVDEMSK